MKLAHGFVKAGHFWLPSNKDQKIPGTLKISESGDTELELMGLFGESRSLFPNAIRIGRINGKIESEGPVTLDNCHYTTRVRSSTISRSIIYVNRVFLGAHFGDNEPIMISGLRFSVEGLDEWLAISGIKTKHWKNRSTSIKFDPLKSIKLKLSNEINLSFTFEWTISQESFFQSKIEQKASIKLESKSLVELNDLTKLAFVLNTFLCFALNEIVTISGPVIITSSKIKHKLSGSKELEVPIKVIYPSLPYSNRNPVVNWHSMLFGYPNVSDILADILQKWLVSYETSGPAYNLYIYSKSGIHRFADSNFLSLAQGIETFHRRNSTETDKPDAEFKALLSKILASCDKSTQEWLKGKLEHANQISFRTRLKRLMEPFKTYFGTDKDRKKLIDDILNTRNYLTHYDPRLEEKACSGDRLIEINDRLEGLFQLFFLSVIGFPNDKIHQIILNNFPLATKLGQREKLLKKIMEKEAIKAALKKD